MLSRSISTLPGVILFVALCGCASEGIRTPEHPDAAVAIPALNAAPEVITPPTTCGELKSWMLAHGSLLTSARSTTHGRFELRYRPAALAACEALDHHPEPKPALDALMLEYSGGMLFQFDLVQPVGSGGFGTGLFTESGHEHFLLISGTDTTDCAFIHPILTPESQAWSSALIGFDREEPDSAFRILITLDPNGAPANHVIFPFPSGLNDHFSAMQKASKTPRS